MMSREKMEILLESENPVTTQLRTEIDARKERKIDIR
jgi:hypothetical protein